MFHGKANAPTILLQGIFRLHDGGRLIKYSQRQKIANPKHAPMPSKCTIYLPGIFAKKGRSSRPIRFSTPTTVNAKKTLRRNLPRFFMVFGIAKAALTSADKAIYNTLCKLLSSGNFQLYNLHYVM
jgi:hypothetical protein